MIASRKEGRSVIRRRQCYHCGHKWNTREVDYFGDRRKRKKRPVEEVKKKPVEKPKRVHQELTPEEVYVPREPSHVEHPADELRELGIDYDWSQD